MRITNKCIQDGAGFAACANTTLLLSGHRIAKVGRFALICDGWIARSRKCAFCEPVKLGVVAFETEPSCLGYTLGQRTGCRNRKRAARTGHGLFSRATAFPWVCSRLASEDTSKRGLVLRCSHGDFLWWIPGCPV